MKAFNKMQVKRKNANRIKNEIAFIIFNFIM
jgi:hypothetical protein